MGLSGLVVERGEAEAAEGSIGREAVAGGAFAAWAGEEAKGELDPWALAGDVVLDVADQALESRIGLAREAEEDAADVEGGELRQRDQTRQRAGSLKFEV